MQNENLTKKELRTSSIKWDLDTKKEVAKIGMAASMAVVVGTSFTMNSKAMKNLHIGAGVTLVGFSLWHHFLYQPAKTTSQKLARITSPQKHEKVIPSAIVFKEMYASIALDGTLTHDELVMFEARLETLLKSYEKPTTLLLADFTKMMAIEVGALWHDLILGFGKHPEINRIAIVGKSRLEKMSISLTNVFLQAELSYFETHEEAKVWLFKKVV